MPKRAIDRAANEKQAGQTNALRQRIRLLGILAVVVISSIVSWIHAPSGQEQGRAWKAIGAIYPRISDGGEAIVFSYQGAVWRIPRQGGTMHRLTRGPGFDVEPAWSHDAKKIAYINTSSGELGLIDAVRGVPVKLPFKLLAVCKLFFHPDGRRLLGNFRLETSQPQSQVLAWLDLERGTLAPVLNPSRPAEVYSLSPDGERLAFISTQDVEGEQEGHDGPQVDIWTVSAKGGKPEKLVRFRSRIFDLIWGADGLYFSTDLGGAHNDLRSGSRTCVPAAPSLPTAPFWSSAWEANLWERLCICQSQTRFRCKPLQWHGLLSVALSSSTMGRSWPPDPFQRIV